MRRRLTANITLGRAFAITAAVGGLLLLRADSSAGFQWDDKASQELAVALHHLHHVANAGDMKALESMIIGDDQLVTFDLASDNKTPVPLRSKAEIFAFFQRLLKDAANESGTFLLDVPKMHCRATSTFGVCTEECTVHMKHSNGDDRLDKLFGTAVAIKHPDGWKWIQWHMSVGAPPAAENKPDNSH